MHTKCPYCFTTLVPQVAAFRCTSCPPSPDAEASRYRGAQVSNPPLAVVRQTNDRSRDVRPSSGNCPACGTLTRIQGCPACHAELPHGWLETSTSCIALAGTAYSGKSVYIGVVVKQLELLASMLGGVLQPVTAETASYYRDVFETSLYEQRGILPATLRQNPGTSAPESRQNTPLVYRFTSATGQPHVIVLRDVAGENLSDPDLDPWLFGFFRRADGIVYLVDPLQITRVRNQVKGFLPLVQQEIRDPLPVLGNVVRLFQSDPEQSGRLVRVALTLSKFDALQSLSEVPESSLYEAMSNRGAAYQRDPSLLDATFDDADSALLNAEIESLLLELGVVTLQNMARGAFQEWRWFAVSALGHQPGTRLGDAGITPFRCLDPVKWILAANGALHTGRT